ncbi:MAG: redoxin domain-containing protein, partial [Candidatus Poribacteria bacterium]|nr:redoxin domain-containing protein [Candidatus Poribacteria bacterium]
DYVLTTGYRSTNYAEHLVDIVRTAKMAGSVSGVSVAIANSSRIEERIRKILAENLNRRPLTKVAAAVGLFVLTCIAVPMGAMRLAEAGNQENALYNEIQSVSNSHPEPLGRDAMEIEKAAWQQVYQLNQEHVISLCDKFLGAFPESRRYDEIWFEKLICFHHLGRGIEFDVGVEAFISQFPTSNYAGTLHKYRARRLESESKFREALAEWDKIDDPTLLHEVYDRKSHLYRRLENYWKETEFDLLRAELILGKPAPEFSHTSIYDVPVSLSDLRGKVVILYHWSTRDGRSSENDVTGGVIARLKRLYAAHKSNPDFALICICIDSRKDLLEKFVKTHTLPGVHLLLKHGEVPHQFGVIGRPHFVVVDKAGILRDSVHRFGLGELELEQLVAALLEEHQSPLDERIVPRIIMARAAYYDTRYERGKSIAEYEKLLAFVPGTPYLQSELSHRKFNFIMEKIHDKLDRRDDATALLNQAFEIIIDASQSSTDFPVMQALQLAHRLSDHGDREKTWALFQLAVNRDDSDYSRAINLAKRRPKILRAIHDMPEYQRLLADTTPTKADVRLDEEIRKRKIHAEVFSDALKSFVAVDADSEIFTGVILTRVGHILVPLSVKEAKSIRVKIRDFQPAKVVAFDAKSDLAVIKADGQRNLRPVVLGSVDLLREYTPTLLPFPDHGQVYTDIWIMSARGHHVDRHQLPHLYQDAVGQPIATYASVVQLDIDNSRAVAVLKVESLGHPGEFIRGDAAVHHDGRLLAISPSKEVKYVNREPCTVQIPIDRIRDALKRMNISELTQLLSTAD